MTPKKLIPFKYQHALPYTYTQLFKPTIFNEDKKQINMRRGKLANIQNENAQIITFYKNISRL